MADKEKMNSRAEEKENFQEHLSVSAEQEKHTVSETWAQDIIEDLDDWIESQGIYLRQ